MSGGHFEYKEFHINDIASTIADLINFNNSGDYPNNFNEETLEIFKDAYYLLRKSYCYAKAIDYLASADTGEDTFKEDLMNQLKKIEELQENKIIENWW